MEPPEEKNEPTITVSQKGGFVIFLAIIVLGIILIAGRPYIQSDFASATTPTIVPTTTQPTPTKEAEGTMCTMDAKQCPDGSYVGRHGPKCEFYPCPTIHK